MNINWTTVIASAITAAIVSGATFISNRYLGKILDKIDKKVDNIKKSGVLDKRLWGNGEARDREDEEGSE